MNEQTYTYCGITAPPALWKELGMREYTNTPFADGPCREGYSPTDGALIEARVSSGATDVRALVWLIQERRRRSELEDQTRAANRRAETELQAAKIRK